MEMVPHISPILAVVALLLASIAASGKFSLNAGNILLFIAWGGGVYAVMQSGMKERHLKIAAECGVGIVVLMVSYWVTQRRIKQSSDSKKE